MRQHVRPVPDPFDPSRGDEEPPRYTRHRSRPGFLSRFGRREDADELAALQALRERERELQGAEDAPPVRDAEGRAIYRAGSGGGGDDDGGRHRGRRSIPLPGLPGRRVAKVGGTITAGWVAKLVLKLAFGWLLISLAAFLVSATIHQTGSGGNALGGGGLPPFGTTNILVLGSDARPKGTREPGADVGGPSRSDTMLLMRVGGGHNTRLSIPRDTVVDIPGHGRTKINAAYAFGGSELAVRTVEQYLGISINHLIEVNFENFPDLIDAMGGVDYTGSCVVSRINGGYKNGGYTLRLKKGTTRIDGKQALALARTRHNDCNPRENDFTRSRRQQKLLSAMKSRVVSFSGFLHGPFIGWNAPKAIKSDMSAPTLLGVFTALGTSGSAPPHVLKTSPQTLPDGSSGQVASDASRRAAVRRFLDG
jgi:LCP family protein required for cell wall assembly